jgi:hypothetical protein
VLHRCKIAFPRANSATLTQILTVDYDYFPRRGIAGFVTFLASNAGWRYIQIKIARSLPRGVQVAILGHELQHAVEIADAAEVVSEASLAAFYGRIGSEHRAGGCRLFDTRAAIDVQQQVFREWRTPRNLHPRHEAVREASSHGVIQSTRVLVQKVCNRSGPGNGGQRRRDSRATYTPSATASAPRVIAGREGVHIPTFRGASEQISSSRARRAR